ncbi:50S ribosomal protein L25 [Phragmitibacter flavus]|uniref:Large ribosomal subunit protein bL25 n=1 Tax=Phragmitibacter flavus TaxID=2576071 RepID=A0A5R8KHL1_9BACT|nr:50S ribosomal protein L25 [Phragmitibacter flavus]TLD71099.1 50S ribosomal protein L25 [Phragmitibacter flavus]
MAKILDLQAKVRSAAGTSSVKRLRKAGSIPAVIYGKKHDHTQLEVDAKTFSALMDGSASDNVLVNLKIEGEKATSLALVQEIQHDYLRGGVLHVDFHAVDATEEIHANIPVILQHIDLAEKKGGQIEHILHNLEVFCLPKDLPETIVIDVSPLEVGGSYHIKDIKLPSGVTTHIDDENVVVALKEPTVAEETAAPAAPAAEAKK